MSGLKRCILVTTIIFLYFCIFPDKIYAGGIDGYNVNNEPEIKYNVISMYFYNFDNNGSMFIDTEKYCFYGNFTEEEKCYIIFDNLINNTKPGKINFIPEGTKLLNVKINNGTLTLNFSKEILKYGGSASERAMIKQLAINALSFKGVNKITLLVDSDISFLPEGVILYETRIWELLCLKIF